jgi:acyl-CoA reductase-like NAD-dependent aldehyde dehydrogenase
MWELTPTGASSLQVEYQPMGVLGAIIPWNYPFHNMLGQVWFDPTHSFLQL